MVKIRSAQWLLFVAIVASAGAMQVREWVAAAGTHRNVHFAGDPAAGTAQPAVRPSARCLSARAGMHAVDCGGKGVDAGVDAARGFSGRRAQRTELWV
jgi:hypothetical protein